MQVRLLSDANRAEIVTLAHSTGYESDQHVSTAELAARYFADRTDGLRLSKKSEAILLATT